MKIEKFSFGKGFEKDGKREYLEIVVKLPDTATDKDFQDEFTAAEYMIDNLLVGVSSEIDINHKPEQHDRSKDRPFLMTMEEIEAMDWKASKWIRPMDADRKARTGEDAYIQSTVADKRLIQMINETPDKKLDLPPYEISFGGDGGLIIRKIPKKEKKQK